MFINVNKAMMVQLSGERSWQVQILLILQVGSLYLLVKSVETSVPINISKVHSSTPNLNYSRSSTESKGTH
jgi:hypothetical protein